LNQEDDGCGEKRDEGLFGRDASLSFFVWAMRAESRKLSNIQLLLESLPDITAVNSPIFFARIGSQVLHSRPLEPAGSPAEPFA
jgi:hypothetical protein